MITNFSGMNDNNKPSSKVLRPPGGGSSDIFGADMPSSTARNVKNHMQSNIFSDKNLSAVKNNVRQGAHRFYFIGGEPRRGQKNVDSYARLFGEPERPFTPGRNHMKSNIQFGGNSQGGNVAAATTLSNGNGHHHVAGSINGKNGGGSVLSTSSSSSVSSSTENLKMNGISKTELEETCMTKHAPNESIKHNIFQNQVPCDTIRNEENGSVAPTEATPESARSFRPEPEPIGVCSQTRKDTLMSTTNEIDPDEPVGSIDCLSAKSTASSRIPRPSTCRNPISGFGMGRDSFEERPRRINTRRDGNPVTGEGYKPSDINSSIPSLNGANQVINKNRIPPGGFSSGLW